MWRINFQITLVTVINKGCNRSTLLNIQCIFNNVILLLIPLVKPISRAHYSRPIGFKFGMSSLEQNSATSYIAARCSCINSSHQCYVQYRFHDRSFVNMFSCSWIQLIKLSCSYIKKKNTLLHTLIKVHWTNSDAREWFTARVFSFYKIVGQSRYTQYLSFKNLVRHGMPSKHSYLFLQLRIIFKWIPDKCLYITISRATWSESTVLASQSLVGYAPRSQL